MLCSSISSDVARAATICFLAAALMAMTFDMTGSQFAVWRRFVGRIVSQTTFRDVCTKSRKWFHARENCFVAGLATKHSGENASNFNMRKIGRKGSSPLPACGEAAPHPNPLPARAGRRSKNALRLISRRGEQIATASDRADHGGLGRIDLDLAPDAHDSEIHRAVEGFGVARIGQFQQSLARQHALR